MTEDRMITLTLTIPASHLASLRMLTQRFEEFPSVMAAHKDEIEAAMADDTLDEKNFTARFIELYGNFQRNLGIIAEVMTALAPYRQHVKISDPDAPQQKDRLQ